MQDNSSTNMLSKEEEAGSVPVNQGEGVPQMTQPTSYQAPPYYQAPPPYYQAPPGGVVYPPGQYPQSQYQYAGPAPVYGQPNIVTFPRGQSNVLIAGQPGPPDHFLMALMVTLFCFFPTGLFAVMRASDARSAVARGDIESATRFSREAKKYINISIVLGILCCLLCFVVMGLYISQIVHAYSELDEIDD